MVFLVFFYIYPVRLAFLAGLNTWVLLGGVGLLCFFYEVTYVKKQITIKKELLRVVLSAFGLPVILILSCLYNGIRDLVFFKYFFAALCVISASYFLTQVYYKLTKQYLSTDKIIDLFITAVVVQDLLGVLMFLNPTLRSFLLGLIAASEHDVFLYEQIQGFRMIGFGAQFFGAGIVNVIALIFLGYKFNRMTFPNTTKLLKFILTYLWIVFIGIFMSRSTMIGVPLSFLIIFYGSPLFKLKISKKVRSVMSAITVLICFLCLVVFLIPTDFFEEYQRLFNWAFELFINQSQSGKAESASTNRLLEMLQTLPTSLKTWVIGDGFWDDPAVKGRYYMHTDVGYLRLIFYTGLLGCLAYFFYQAQCIMLAYKKFSNNFCFMWWVIFLALLILNIKGFTNFLPYAALFFFVKSDHIKS